MIKTKILEIMGDISNCGTEKKLVVNNIFKLPISYIDTKYKLQNTIKEDLELIPIADRVSLYTYVFNPSTIYESKNIELWSEYYTTDVEFLKDTQSLIKNFKDDSIKDDSIKDDSIKDDSIKDDSIKGDSIKGDTINNYLIEILKETGFCEKYHYINIKFFEWFNHSSSFLQLLTIYNLTSPMLSLLAPVLMMIVPFFILRSKNLRITFSGYIEILLKLVKQHGIGKAITEYSSASLDRKCFILMSVIFYFVNIYQNIVTCYTFYKNIFKMKQYLFDINNFLIYSKKSITNFNSYCKTSYNKFVEVNEKIKDIITIFSNEITKINLNNVSIKHLGNIGKILKSFYQLFKNQEYIEAIQYCLYFDGYVNNICNLQKKLAIKEINYCKFNKKKTTFTKAYFAPLVNDKPIKNTYDLTKNIIITGPNTSGKTTLLKTTALNIILSQQLGIGFYKKAKINPYNYIHSYINIPDTSERDSLFQAEARRCKEILDAIENSNKDERHFCIFDEIYSGTNPSEAVASAYSFLIYTSKITKFEYMLTTHYISLCNLVNNNKNIINKQMRIDDDRNTYELIHGISNIRGGIKVLRDLSYSDVIISNAQNVLKDLII